MRGPQEITVALGIMLAVLLPLEQARCASLPLRPASPVHHPDDRMAEGRDCHNESSPLPAAPAPLDPCCGTCQQLPATTAPVTASLTPPSSVSTLHALLPATIAAIEPGPLADLITRGFSTASPPGLSSSPQCPRSPPYSA